MAHGLGLALGGGAARGYAHMGVLQVLDEAGIRPAVMTGTSMGAVIGGLYAWFGTARETIDHIRRFLSTSDTVNQAVYRRIIESEQKPANLWENLSLFLNKGILYGKTLASQSMVSKEVVYEAFRTLVPDVDIRDCRIPFGAVVSDLVEGEELLVTAGSLRTALMASSAIPGVYPPVEVGDMVLIDGGWTNKVPVNPCYQMGASEVVAVCVSRELEDTEDFNRGMDIIIRSNAVATHRLAELQKMTASLVLYPPVEHIHWADFSQVEPGVAAGVTCARENLSRIRALARKAAWTRFLKSKKNWVREISL